MTAEADVSVAAVARPRRRVIGPDFQTYGAPPHAAPDLLDGAQQHRTETEASRSLVHRQGVDAQMAGIAPDAHDDAGEGAPRRRASSMEEGSIRRVVD